MNVLLHPAYFPNIAFMAILAQRQVCWEVWDNYQKQTYRNRCYICTDQGKLTLTIPIRHVGGTNGRQLYRDVKIDNSYSWQRLHWRSLQTAYRASPFFEFFEEDFAALFTAEFEFLMDFNLTTVETICNCLQIPLPTCKTEVFQLTPSEFEDGRFLINAKTELPISQNTYVQVFHARHGFIGNLSVLDLLFNEGTAALSYLENLKLDFLNA